MNKKNFDRRKLLSQISLTVGTGFVASRFQIPLAIKKKENCKETPILELGPYAVFIYKKKTEYDIDLTQVEGNSAIAVGQIITVFGRITDKNCNPIKKAVVEPNVEPMNIGKEFKLESFVNPNSDVKDEEIFDLKLPEKQQIPIARKPDGGEKIKNENGAGNGRNEFLAALQRVFVKIEKFVDSVSKQGGFQKTFKKACIEKSDSYPFLDPFEGQFDYQGKKIRLDATIETEEFTRAIAECLNLTLTYIRKELPKNVVFPPGLKTDIESVFKKRPDLTGVFTF